VPQPRDHQDVTMVSMAAGANPARTDERFGRSTATSQVWGIQTGAKDGTRPKKPGAVEQQVCLKSTATI